MNPKDLAAGVRLVADEPRHSMHILTDLEKRRRFLVDKLKAVEPFQEELRKVQAAINAMTGPPGEKP